MSIEDTYEGFITAENGSITFHNQVEEGFFRDFLRQHDEEKLWMTLEADNPSRSSRQNRFYWVFLEKIAQTSGHMPEELHNTFKHAFLQPKTVKGLNGRTYKEPPSTTDLSKKEFSDYIRKIEMKTGISTPSRKRYGLGQG